LHYGVADQTEFALRLDLWSYLRSQSEFLFKIKDKTELLSLLQKVVQIRSKTTVSSKNAV